MVKNKVKKNITSTVIDWSQIRDSLEVFLHWRKPKLDIDLSEEIYHLLRKLRTPIIVMILILTTGTIGYMAIDNYNPLDALYMTVITIATVGYGEISETSETGRIFTILLIFSGIGSFAYSTGIIINIISEGALFKVLKERFMVRHIGLLEKHFIICGYNETSREIIKQFKKKGTEFVVVDDKIDIEKSMHELNVEHYVIGTPFKDENLRKSHISTCKGIISTSSNDNDNFAIVVSAKILIEKYNNTHATIISIARNNENKEKLLKIGASHVITPQIIAGQRLVTCALKPETFYFMSEMIYSDKTDVDIEELHIYKSCKLTDKPVRETDFKESGLTVLSIKKDDQIITPVKGDAVLEINDTLIIIGNRSDIQYYVKKNMDCFSE